jgi:6-phosphogluconate dehydrogenase
VKIGLVGLGRMGSGIAERLRRAGHDVIGFDQNPAISQVGSIEELVRGLPSPHVVWVMVPAGGATIATVEELASTMNVGDIIIDGGNSYYKDTMRLSMQLRQKGINLMDVGTSGGIWGLKEGFSLMAGGDRGAYNTIEPLLQALAPTPETGYGYMGPSGAGHYVKMVHNGIEYGLMEAYAEGFELMQAKKEFELDLEQIANVWLNGSVVRSWLLELGAAALKEDPGLESLEAYVDDSGEGRWTVQETVDLAVPAPAIYAALQARFRSRQERPIGGRLLAALRNQFGGHAVKEHD